MESSWKIWTTATNASKTQRVAGLVVQRVGFPMPSLQVEPSPKGGHVVSFRVVHDEESWTELVVSLLRFAQRVGQGWIVRGADDEIELWGALAGNLTHFNVPGVSAMQVGATRYKL